MKYVCFLFLLSFVGVAWGQGYGAAVVSGAQDVALSDQQITLYSEQALGGDSDAANRLGQYFSMIKGDRTRAERWYLISAENGDIGAQRTYATMVLKDSKDDEIRAIFWLKKSSEGGDSLARAALEKLQH